MLIIRGLIHGLNKIRSVLTTPFTRANFIWQISFDQMHASMLAFDQMHLSQ
jgi:hypothetical protein